MGNGAVQKAIDELSKGNIMILVDDSHRENEGDFVQVAQYATPQSVNFMITHGRGLLCHAFTQAQADRLRLDRQVAHNTSLHATAFTVSVDARDGTTTGVSAFDRAQTIQVLNNPQSTPEELSRPGHVFPLVAEDGGVLARRGHTEAAVDLATRTGNTPAAIICEILNKEGRAAQLDELLSFAQHHHMVVLHIEALVQYLETIKE